MEAGHGPRSWDGARHCRKGLRQMQGTRIGGGELLSWGLASEMQGRGIQETL